MTSSVTSPSGVQVSLNNVELWTKFQPNQEMIVTPVGRKLFPDLKYDVTGLNENELYTVYIYLERIDRHTYKFNAGQWEEAGKGEAIPPIVKKEHKDGAKKGCHWMSKPISFDHIRITNNQENEKEQCLLVHSMHKFQPVVTIKRYSDGIEEEFRLDITAFYAVTAYQSPRIINLKKNHNKFASGFREKGKHTRNATEDAEPESRKRSKTSSPWGVQYPTPPPSTPPAFNFHMDAFGMGYGGAFTTPPQIQAPNNQVTPPMAQNPLAQTLPPFPGTEALNGQPTFSMAAQNNPIQAPPTQAMFYDQFYNNPYNMMFFNPMGGNNGNRANQEEQKPTNNFGFGGF